jgi:hypothetical protein
MKRTYIAALLFWFLLAGAAPAYANNPPLPDGLLFLALLGPVVMLALRIARVTLAPRSRLGMILRTGVLTLGFVAAMAGDGLAIVPVIVFLAYGMVRGVQIIRRGQGRVRMVAGLVVMLFAMFAVANYFASLIWGPSTEIVEAIAVGNLRRVLEAEREFQSKKLLDRNNNGIGEFGSIDQLQNAGLLSSAFRNPSELAGYRHAVELSGDPERDEREFFACAVPIHYGDSRNRIFEVSLVRVFRPAFAVARRSFAIDQTGACRAADLGNSRSVERRETATWKPL